MNLSDELQKLRDLHNSGALSAAEYEAAKARLLNPGVPGTPPPMPAAAPAYAPPAAALAGSGTGEEAATRQWAMFLHLSQLAGFLVPLGGLIAPIVIWQIKKKELPGIDVHGCHAANWVITEVIIGIICIPLCFILIGIPMLVVLGLLSIVFPVIAAVKGNNGEVWRYPLSFTFFKPTETRAAALTRTNW